jgi:hypothetical protein
LPCGDAFACLPWRRLDPSSDGNFWGCEALPKSGVRSTRVGGPGLRSPRVAPTSPELDFGHPSYAAGTVDLTCPGWAQLSIRTGTWPLGANHNINLLSTSPEELPPSGQPAVFWGPANKTPAGRLPPPQCPPRVPDASSKHTKINVNTSSRPPSSFDFDPLFWRRESKVFNGARRRFSKGSLCLSMCHHLTSCGRDRGHNAERDVAYRFDPGCNLLSNRYYFFSGIMST